MYFLAIVINNCYWKREQKYNQTQNFSFILQPQIFTFAPLNKPNLEGKPSNISPQIDISS